MGIVFAFILGCLVTVWWKVKPLNQKSGKLAKQVDPVGTRYFTKTLDRQSTPKEKETEIPTAKVSKNTVVDDELKDILLEYMVDQVKKGKIKIIEDV